MYKKRVIKILLYAIFLGTVVFFIIPVPDDGDYCKDEWYKYYLFTDGDIKDAPKISPHYYFTFNSPDGGQRRVSAITFSGGNIDELRVYLKKTGYYLYDKDDGGKSENWFPIADKDDMFILWHNADNSKIVLTKTFFGV